ncbi:type ISP restriction/modification enzyme [Facklamia languida]
MVSKRPNYLINRNKDYIKWTVNLEKRINSNEIINYDSSSITKILYRPFTKKWIYYNKNLVERPSKYFYNNFGQNNMTIITTGRGIRNKFSVFVSKDLVSLDCVEKTQAFFRFDNNQNGTLLLDNNDNIMKDVANKYKMSSDAFFYYIYALLHSPKYQSEYELDLKKDLARIPMVKYKEKYIEIGKKLVELQLNYEHRTHTRK